MSRRQNLISQLQQTVFNHRQNGAHSTRAKNRQVLLAIVGDMSRSRLLPKNWGMLNNAIVTELVRLWLKKKNSVPTVHNKLTILRKTLAQICPRVALMKNSEFITSVRTPRQTQEFNPNILRTLLHETTISILEFEYYFGLTKAESIKLNMPTVEVPDGRIIIDRTVAHNKKIRHVPIWSEEQRAALLRRKALLNGNSSLTQSHSYAKLSALYSAEMAVVGSDGRPRNGYIKQRFSHLRQSMEESACLALLCEETGINSPYKLRRYL